MRASLASSFALALTVLSGCSTPAAVVDAARIDARSSDASSIDAASVDAAATDAATTDAATTDAATTDAAALDSGPTDAGPASFTVLVIDPYAYGSCFGGPPDPLLLTWTARVAGPAGDVITLTQATLHVVVARDGYTEDQVITVTVPSFSIPAGGTIDQEQRKATGTPRVPVCTFCDTTVTGTLDVSYASSGGGSVRVSTPITDIGCVF